MICNLLLFLKVCSKFIDPIKEVLEGISENEVDKVILSGGTSKIPKLQKSISDMFPNAELLSSINADEVIAVGAANQASLIMDKDTLDFNQMNQNGTITVHATTHAIVYCLPNQESLSVLIPAHCPIPVRRSHHLSWENEDKLTIKLFVQAKSDKKLLDLAEVSLHFRCAEKGWQTQKLT